MAYKKKTAREKLLDSKDLPRVQRIDARQERMWGGGTIVIPAPVEVDEVMRSVPKRRKFNLHKQTLKLVCSTTREYPALQGGEVYFYPNNIHYRLGYTAYCRQHRTGYNPPKK